MSNKSIPMSRFHTQTQILNEYVFSLFPSSRGTNESEICKVEKSAWRCTAYCPVHVVWNHAYLCTGLRHHCWGPPVHSKSFGPGRFSVHIDFLSYFLILKKKWFVHYNSHLTNKTYGTNRKKMLHLNKLTSIFKDFTIPCVLSGTLCIRIWSTWKKNTDFSFLFFNPW